MFFRWFYFFKFAQVKKVKMSDQATYLFSTRTSKVLAEKIAKKVLTFTFICDIINKHSRESTKNIAGKEAAWIRLTSM